VGCHRPCHISCPSVKHLRALQFSQVRIFVLEDCDWCTQQQIPAEQNSVQCAPFQFSVSYTSRTFAFPFLHTSFLSSFKKICVPCFCLFSVSFSLFPPFSLSSPFISSLHFSFWLVIHSFPSLMLHLPNFSTLNQAGNIYWYFFLLKVGCHNISQIFQRFFWLYFA
jgi:hypothetical protein